MRFLRITKKGFTLLELMVVVTIIGLLATIVLSALNDARMKGRDAQRIKSVKEIQKAIDLYYSTNGFYPVENTARSGSTVATDICSHGERGDANWCNLMNDLAAYYPGGFKDPSGDNQVTYRFYYDSDTADGNSTYGLMAMLEAPSNAYLADGDGGVYCSNDPAVACARKGFLGYELGTQPAACQSQGQTNWWSSAQSVCP